MIRVLVVDDSVVVRRMLSDALAADPRINVVGTASNGSIALQRLTQVNPDIVVLDVEMPDMDGIETVRRLRPEFPNLPVIMCSSLTERGADVTLRALAAGATDYVAKPTAADGHADRLRLFKQELLGKVIALGEAADARSVRNPIPDERESRTVVPEAGRKGHRVITALTIGCSTGGPNALSKVFERIPKDLPVPVFIVQHMPPLFTKLLADRLTAQSGVSVVEAEDGGLVEPGRVYIAPGDYHMVVGRHGARFVTRLNQEHPENSCRPAVDVLFRSLAKEYGDGVLACVLTGMGQDGARGAQNIVDAGGSVVVQSAETCVVPSMPGAVLAAGLAERILPLDRIADELIGRVRRANNPEARVSALAQGGA